MRLYSLFFKDCILRAKDNSSDDLPAENGCQRIDEYATEDEIYHDEIDIELESLVMQNHKKMEIDLAM